MRVLTWNLTSSRGRWAGRLADRLELLEQLDDQFGRWDIFFAQEVPQGGFDELLAGVGEAAGKWAWHEQQGMDAATPTGAAVLVRPPWTLEQGDMLDDAPSPKRTMAGVARNTATGERVAVLSAALPPAGIRQGQQPPQGREVWGDRKATQARVIAGWVQERVDDGLPVIVGIDANGPEQDPPEWAEIGYWWDDEALLLGPDAVAKDAFRVWLRAHPEEFERLRIERPQGPLACTHRRGRTTPSRYDHLLVTGDIGVTRVNHIEEPAFAAGSDHALVRADVTLAPR